MEQYGFKKLTEVRPTFMDRVLSVFKKKYTPTKVCVDIFRSDLSIGVKNAIARKADQIYLLDGQLIVEFKGQKYTKDVKFTPKKSKIQ